MIYGNKDKTLCVDGDGYSRTPPPRTARLSRDLGSGSNVSRVFKDGTNGGKTANDTNGRARTLLTTTGQQ